LKGDLPHCSVKELVTNIGRITNNSVKQRKGRAVKLSDLEEIGVNDGTRVAVCDFLQVFKASMVGFRIKFNAVDLIEDKGGICSEHEKFTVSFYQKNTFPTTRIKHKVGWCPD